MKLWLNGKIANAWDTRIDPTDRGFLLGDGLFETMLVRQSNVALFEEHMIRLMKGAEVTGIRLPYTPDQIEAASDGLLEANGLADAPRVALRLTLTRGTGPRGLALPPEPRPTVLLTCAASAVPPERLSLATVAPRRNPWSPSARLKALPYLDNVLAKEEAHEKGADDALLLDTGGNIACASAANIFIWEGDRLVTPADRGAILPGITRAALLELAPGIGIKVAEEDITPERLARADGAFLTNSLMGIVPVSRLDGTELPTHPLTARLSAAYELFLDAAAENGN